MTNNPQRSRATEMVGRWSFRVSAFEFGFVMIQWLAFGNQWLGSLPVIPAALLAIVDALLLSLTGLFTIVAVAAQLRSKTLMWHPVGGLLLVAGASWFAIETFTRFFGHR